MKNQRLVITSCLLMGLIACFLTGCTSQARKPVVGSALGQDMLTLLPADTSAFFVLDLNRLINLKTIEKKLLEQKEFESYKQKIEAFNLDLKKDVYYLTLAVAGEINKPADGLAAVINLKYQQDKLMPPGTTDKNPEIKTYNGISYFPMIESEGKTIVCLAFLDSSNLALGSEGAIKKIIDVYNGKVPNLLSNKNIQPVIKDLNTRAMTFGWLMVPSQLLESEFNENPSMAPLSKVRSVSSFSDYKNSSYMTEIKIYAGQKDDLKPIADILSGFKSLGLGLGNQTPQLAEVIQGIEITTTEKYLKIFISLNEEQVEAIGKLIKEKGRDTKPVRQGED
ncbi:MAG: hypothetical protein PHU81_04160 [Acidobacteriota bacterium]|nr:hypothetical protein [Acidobacteriota bacterium]